jgi:citrate lyase subunit beta/citryl-CoA lyase
VFVDDRAVSAVIGSAREAGGPPARRSCLSVPGSSERKLAGAAAGLGADEIVIDLEDAVAAPAKDDARAATVAALAGWSGGVVSVRVNAARSPWCHLDVAALARPADVPASIVVPKVEGAGDLAFFDRLLDGVEAASGRRRPVRLQALIETAAGLERVSEIAGASQRLDALILGYADLAASLGRAPGAARDLEVWRPAQEAVLVAARAHGLQAIDGPYLGVEVDESFRAAAARARELGFDGKWAIHPAQVAALNELFTPTVEEIQRAEAIVAALERAERKSGQGAVAVDGQMLDEALRAAALRILARASQRGAVG